MAAKYPPPSPPFIRARNQGGRQTPKAIVMHGTVSSDNAGTARNIARWWNGAGSPMSSCHYVVDPKEVIQCVGDHSIAYHCGYNTGSIGVELCDEQTGPASRWRDADSKAIIARAARLVAELCLAYDIEPVRPSIADLKRKGPHGIYGHNDSRLAFGHTTHTDPRDFDWRNFLRLVRAEIAKIKAQANGGNTGTKKDKMVPEAYFVGAKGPHVRWLANRLVKHGFKRFYKNGVDKTFTAGEDRKALAAFQRSQGWKGQDANGLPGPVTLKRLAAKPKPKHKAEDPKPEPQPDPKPEPKPAPETPYTDVLVAAKAGIRNAEAARRAAARAGIPFWAACALLEKESHGRNVYGHDKGAERPAEYVTKANFEPFYQRVLNGALSNGVGPCQITWAGSVKNGKRDGGYFREMLSEGLRPWHVGDNMFFGFRLLRRHYTANGDSWEKAGTRYNGRESYGADFLAKVKEWRARLDPKAPLNPVLDGEPEPEPEPDKPKRKSSRIRFAHASMQFSDSPDQVQHDAEKLFDRFIEKDVEIITGTEANDAKVWRRLKAEANKAGYRFFKQRDCWIAVQRDLIKGGWKSGYVPVIESHEGVGRHTDKGIVWVSFNTEKYGRITVGAAHYLTKGRPNAKSPEYRQNLEFNARFGPALTKWAKEHGKGNALVFYGGDQNIVDRTADTFFGAPLTSAWDELKHYENTGHGNIDVIASYDRDGRVKAKRIHARNDKRFHLHTDHFLVEAVYEVKHLPGR